MIILSTVDGLYVSEADSKNNDHNGLINHVSKINAKIKKMAGQASEMGKGGMISKVQAAEICLKNNSAMVTASGKKKHPIKNLSGNGRATWFVKK